MAMRKTLKVGGSVVLLVVVFLVILISFSLLTGPSAPVPAVDVLTRLQQERAALAENADEHYRAALDSLTDGFDRAWGSTSEADPNLPAEARAWLAENDAAFDHLRAAGRITTCRFPVPNSVSLYYVQGQFGELRTLARVVKLRALVAAEARDRETYVECVRMLDVLARHVWQTPVLLDQLVGTAIAQLGQDLVLRPLTWDTLSAQEKSRYGTQVSGTFEPPPDLTPTLKNESQFILEVYRSAPHYGLMRLVCPERRVLGETVAYVTPALDLAAAPLAERANPDSALHRAHEQEVAKQPFVLNIPGMLARIASDSSFDRAIEISARFETIQRGHRTVIELFHHFNRHGQFPQRLTDLAGAADADYLIDPFGEAPFLYERDGDGFRLWSRGLDGDDDDGEHAEHFGERQTPVDGDYLFWPLPGD